MRHEPVLITGCSTGIGRATASHLAGNGWKVYATARRPETITDIQGCETLPLDVTDEASMESAVALIEERHGAVGALVNNAGYGLQGAIETTDLDEVRVQFETNFFGLARLTQLVLPGMRRAGHGRIVNMSSMGGRLTFPGGGFYHASKHAVEAFSDALRFELGGFGIDVVIIEPGIITTAFGDTAVKSVDAADPDDPYGPFNQGLLASFTDAYKGTMSRIVGSPPEAVAKVVERSLEATRPRTRYIVTIGAHLILVVRRVLPDRAFDAVLRTSYKQPGR